MENANEFLTFSFWIGLIGTVVTVSVRIEQVSKERRTYLFRLNQILLKAKDYVRYVMYFHRYYESKLPHLPDIRLEFANLHREFPKYMNSNKKSLFAKMYNIVDGIELFKDFEDHLFLEEIFPGCIFSELELYNGKINEIEDAYSNRGVYVIKDDEIEWKNKNFYSGVTRQLNKEQIEIIKNNFNKNDFNLKMLSERLNCLQKDIEEAETLFSSKIGFLYYLRNMFIDIIGRVLADIEFRKKHWSRN